MSQNYNPKQSNNLHKLIIDTDPGCDDAMALLYAVNHPHIELLGLTTVFGNGKTIQTTQNALDLLNLFKMEHIPVAKGADEPLEKILDRLGEFVHGDNSIGNITIPKSSRVAEEISAAEFIVQQVLANPHEITICAIAPLTNLALALEIEPKIAKLVKEVVIMGGAIRVNGNVTPAAEANINNDPLAADIVLNAGWPVTLIGLNVTERFLLTHDFMKEFASINKEHGEPLYNITRFYDDFYRQTRGYDGFICHDVAALLYITNPEFFECTPCKMRVITEGLCEGMTMMDDLSVNYGDSKNPWSDSPVINVCLDTSKDYETILQELKTHWFNI